MALKGDDRPDGLVIHDDHLVEHAASGLLSSGVRIPEDLDVVAHANFPLISSPPLPIRRLGFDCVDLLRRCVAAIGSLRRGETPAMEQHLPALFEDELPIRRVETPRSVQSHGSQALA